MAPSKGYVDTPAEILSGKPASVSPSARSVRICGAECLGEVGVRGWQHDDELVAAETGCRSSVGK